PALTDALHFVRSPNRANIWPTSQISAAPGTNRIGPRTTRPEGVGPRAGLVCKCKLRVVCISDGQAFTSGPGLDFPADIYFRVEESLKIRKNGNSRHVFLFC